MVKDNRNNGQIYGRNDMIMLDQNNKIYGSLGLADRYVMKTEEGTKLTLSNPKLGSFDDVLTEFNIYGMSKQESTTGANLIDVDSMLNECLVKNADDTYSILRTETNRFSKSFPVNLKAGTKIRFDADVIEYNGTYHIKLQCNFGQGDTVGIGQVALLRKDVTKVTIYQEGKNDVGTYTKFKNAMLSIGEEKIPYEPYTGGKPSPSPEYPQEIKSVVNPTVKVSSEDGLNVQSVTLNNITLNAIPVSSGGNYTDQSGQQWIADYVDVERGVKVQRIKVKELSPDDKWAYRKLDSGNNNFQIRILNADVAVKGKPCFCNILRYTNNMWNDIPQNLPKIYANESEITISFPPNSEYSSLEAFKQLLTDVKSVIYYILVAPIETPLTPVEIAAYKELSIKAPTTIIENNYDAWMKATYKSTESV